ncbi:hypothetical protein J6590_032708 [Homalodisca vitripennis]|nr:hypothetical protein J6590_032708 [Homalodisca vitripennis]
MKIMSRSSRKVKAKVNLSESETRTKAQTGLVVADLIFPALSPFITERTVRFLKVRPFREWELPEAGTCYRLTTKEATATAHRSRLAKGWNDRDSENSERPRIVRSHDWHRPRPDRRLDVENQRMTCKRPIDSDGRYLPERCCRT